ncbi:MAG: LAGLIDADG family homing endonuclease, partial [Candidatus Aenigmatarchaeota archaeon]
MGSDGHLSKKESAIIIVNRDKEFLEKEVIPLLKELTNKKVSISKSSSGYGDYKYLVRVWDKKLQEKLNKIYGIPRGKKSRINLSIHEREVMDFILGWIAGDGSITVDRERPKIEIWSKDIRLIKFFQKFLFKKKIESSIFKAFNNRFILRISKIDSVKRFS